MLEGPAQKWGGFFDTDIKIRVLLKIFKFRIVY